MFMKVCCSLFLSLIIISCSSNDILSYGNYKLKNNRCYNLIDSNYELCVDSISDSRCPEDVVCIWEGNAKVYFSLKSPNENTSFTLNTFRGFQTDSILKGFKFTLLDVLPYPVNTTSSEQNNYNVEINITDTK